MDYLGIGEVRADTEYKARFTGLSGWAELMRESVRFTILRTRTIRESEIETVKK